jgi:hypothetical protein
LSIVSAEAEPPGGIAVDIHHHRAPVRQHVGGHVAQMAIGLERGGQLRAPLVDQILIAP